MSIFVNNIEISNHKVNEEMQYHPASSQEEARYKAAQALVIRELLLQAAIEQKLLKNRKELKDLEEEKAIDLLIKQEISIPKADKKSCQRYYKQNKEKFIDKKNQKLLPFKSVFSYIESYLQTRSLRVGIGYYIRLLGKKAHITGFDLETGY